MLDLIHIVLHLNLYLGELLHELGWGIYPLLFAIIFCETGLVVTPFLPGDSLLFAAGSVFAAAGLPIHYLWPLLIVAVFCGDNTNYWLGHYLGPKVFHDQNRWLKREHLNKTHAFYEKHGPKAIILARFVPIIRTFMPFVAGVGAMTYKRFISWSFVAAVIWVSLLLNLSYYFGGIPWVKTHFSVVILAIIILSLLPPAIELLKARAKR